MLAHGNRIAAAAQQHIYDDGVSAELAESRKQEITNLRYDLHFDIPDKRATAVDGRAVITFRLSRRQEIIIDFKAAESSVKNVVANGKAVPYTYRNEHIILPEISTKDGENEIKIEFVAGDQSLNRNEEFLYTLLVPDRARTLFPCFDQPSLKARYTLSLDVPASWEAVSNTAITETTRHGEHKTLSFATTELLSTYLFSFVAGKMEKRSFNDGKRTMTAYYRETDPAKVAQLDTIFRQVSSSLRWMEDYTGIPYPFSKYDFIILPGFQYGGMEHAGAILYNDTRMFLNRNATPDDELARTQLIAHETAHCWFGDMVTMEWFDDVWTKEVFANYFAIRISEPLFPRINHKLNWLKTYTTLALAEDRTPGTTPIRQQLGNLQEAGLTYGNIIYDKAPVMLSKLIDMMGEHSFHDGIKEYLRTYAYKNATWDDLIDILDKHTPQDLADFSRVWVYQKGMPTIHFKTNGSKLAVIQEDPYRRGLCWPQQFDITVCGAERDTVLTVSLQHEDTLLRLPFAPIRVLPNTDGRGYGLLVPDESSTEWLLGHWFENGDETARLSMLMLLYENYQAKLIRSESLAASLLNGLRQESNPLIAAAIVNDLYSPLRELPQETRTSMEDALYRLSGSHSLKSCRTQLLQMLITTSGSHAMTQRLSDIWENHDSPLLSENDYTTLAYELAVRMPKQSQRILETQRQRIKDPDRLRQFDFISRAAAADTASLDSLFASLLKPENRRIEPWAAATLAYLNHSARGQYGVKYIRPALEAMIEIQRTGDIFFPRSWAGALLRHHRSRQAYQEVQAFFADNPAYPQFLKNKILQAAYPLYRANK